MTFDTNILIAYLNGEQAVVDFLITQKEAGRALLISAISVVELLSFPTFNSSDSERIRKFLEGFMVIPVSVELADTIATLRRIYKLSIPDAAIAATALANQSPIVTRDRGFRKIKELTFIEV